MVRFGAKAPLIFPGLASTLQQGVFSMKLRHVFFLTSIMTCAASQAVLANDHSSKEGRTAVSGASASDIRLSKLMDANVASKSGENLGQLEDLVINPQTGKIEFAVLGRGGFLGLGEKYVPIPWKAIQVSSEKQFTLNVDKAKLKTAPTTDKNLSQLEEPGYTVTIYRFFEVPVETGGAEAPGGVQEGGASSSPSATNNWNKTR